MNFEYLDTTLQMMVSCQWCDKSVQQRSLKTHNLSATCINIKKIKMLEGHDMMQQNSEDNDMIQQQSDNRENNIMTQQNLEYRDYEQEEFNETKVYQMDMPINTLRECPCERCSFRSTKRTKMRRHFRSRHLQHIIIINEEGLLPQCHQCGIFQNNVNSDQHLQSEDCKRYTDVKNNKRQDRCNMAATNVNFQLNGNDIKKVSDFKYLGRIINNKDNDLKAVENQLKKARATWGRIGKILKIKTDSNIKIMSIFYKVIVQTILLFGAESWVINENVRNKLRTFHNRCARFITGRFITKEEDIWIFPDTKTTLEVADLLSIDEYIMNRRNTISEYAMGTKLYSKCANSGNFNKSDNKLEWWRVENTVCLDIPNQNSNRSSIFDVAEIPELGAIQ